MSAPRGMPMTRRDGTIVYPELPRRSAVPPVYREDEPEHQPDNPPTVGYTERDAEKVLARLIAGNAVDAPPPKSIGSRTLADLPYGDPPEPLVPPFLTPDGPTVIYGPGGVGKGLMSVWFTLHLVRTGMRVMIVDYEHHEREWGQRARSMGYTEEELASVQYRAPFGPDWEDKRGSLMEVADRLRTDCDEHAIDYVIVDSYVAATSNGDSMGGAAGAQEFYQGLVRIGRPALVIAHVAGGQARFPDKPFGSVYVHNFARETWAVESTSESTDDVPFDPETWRFQPRVVGLELRNKKKNDGPKPKPQYVTFSFYFDGHVEVDHAEPKPGAHAEMVEDVLRRASGPMSVKAIVQAIKAEQDEPLTERQVRRVLDKDATAKRGSRFSSTSEVPKRYTLAGREVGD